MKCKLFVGTLTRFALDWFSGLLNNSIAHFNDFLRLFVAQFAGNKESPATTTDLFDVRQHPGESLNEYLTWFDGVVIWVIDWDERMIIAAFCKGLHAEPFRESLVRRQPDIVANVRSKVTCHIEAEEAMTRKKHLRKRRSGRLLSQVPGLMKGLLETSWKLE